MAYNPPANLNDEDKAREQALVEALRDVLKASRDLLSAAEDARGLEAWRWRVDMAHGEATDLAIRIRKPLRRLEGPPIEEVDRT